MLKTTALGGIVFLLPFGILLVVLHEVSAFALRLAEPIASLFPKDDYVGISLASLLAIVFIVLTCFLAGLAARHSALSGVSSKTDRFLTNLIPGYGMIRTRIAAAMNNDDAGVPGQVVNVQAGGLKRLAFLIEEQPGSDEVLIFLPNAPNAEAGVLAYVRRADITPVDVPAHRVLRAFQFYGRGLSQPET